MAEPKAPRPGRAGGGDRKRGLDPRDRRSFATDQLPRLRRATADLSWLLEREYSAKAALALVGNRYQLLERQRTAVGRCAAGESAVRRRGRQLVSEEDLRGREIWVDGYNVLLTVETALDGGILLLGRDGVLRDLSALSRHYRRVGATEPALQTIGECLATSDVGRVRWLFDRPISNSGRLRALTEAVGERAGWSWSAELVPNPDLLLRRAGDRAVVATADTGILDRAGVRWISLARDVVEHSFGSLEVLADEAVGTLVDLSRAP